MMTCMTLVSLNPLNARGLGGSSPPAAWEFFLHNQEVEFIDQEKLHHLIKDQQ